MDRTPAIALSRDERQALLDLKAEPTTPGRVAIRASIILQLAAGATRQQAAARLGISIPTVALWQRRYALGGIDHLRDTLRSGRPRLAGRLAQTTSPATRRAGPDGGEPRPPPRPDVRPSEPELDWLLGAARRTISRRGFSATRVSDIAAEAGVSPATIHYYFQTKNEILVRALLWASQQLLPELSDDANADDAVTLMARYIESTIPYAGVQRDEYLLEIDLWSHVRLHPELLPAWESYEERWLAHVTALIALGIRTGAFTSTIPAAELAERLVALTDGLSAQTAISASRMPPQRVRRLILRFASEQLSVPFEVLDERASRRDT